MHLIYIIDDILHLSNKFNFFSSSYNTVYRSYKIIIFNLLVFLRLNCFASNFLKIPPKILLSFNTLLFTF